MGNAMRLEQAIRLAKMGDTQAALDALEAFLERAPDHYEARGLRAWMLTTAGRYEEAADEYAHLVEREPRDLEATLRWAQVLRKLDRASEALELTRRILTMDPFCLAALDLWRECALERLPPAKTVSASSALPDARPAQAEWLNPVLSLLEEKGMGFPVSVHPSVGRLLYSFARCIRPNRVIETGCFLGYSTLCLAQALQDNGQGHIHSFDLFASLPEGVSSPLLPDCRDALQVARAHAEKAGLAQRITFHKGDSAPSIEALLHAHSEPVELVFIDGDHLIEGCLKDWRAVIERVQPGGLVLLHDTKPNACRWVGPQALLDECRRRPREFQAVNLATPEGFGLGVIQKIGIGEPGVWNPRWRDLLKEALQSRIWQKR